MAKCQFVPISDPFPLGKCHCVYVSAMHVLDEIFAGDCKNGSSGASTSKVVKGLCLWSHIKNVASAGFTLNPAPAVFSSASPSLYVPTPQHNGVLKCLPLYESMSPLACSAEQSKTTQSIALIRCLYNCSVVCTASSLHTAALSGQLPTYFHSQCTLLREKHTATGCPLL